MDPSVRRELRVKRGRQKMSLSDEDWKAITLSKHFDVRTRLKDARRADKDHFQGSSGELGFQCLDGAVNLATIGIALDSSI